MELDLGFAVTLRSGTYSVVIAPPDLIQSTLNTNKALERFLFLYVCGNYSRVLNGIHRTANFDVRRAFTAHQLVTILSESYHTVILVEHDPTLYTDPERNMLMAQVTRALKAAAQEAMVILYASSPDRSIRTLANQADRLFLLTPPEPTPSLMGRSRRPGKPAGPRLQTTLEAYYGTHNREQPHGSKDPCRPMDESNAGTAQG